MTDQKPAGTREQDGRLPYRLRETFLSTPELALFRVLKSMAGRHYVVCPKVALNDIFYVARPNENVHYYNKFFRKHVDFLLCEPVTLRPAIGIELVKPTGRNEKGEVEQFMQELFLNARLPLVHIPSSDRYSSSELEQLLERAIKRVKETGPLRAVTKVDSVPMCPVCGRMMVLRIHRSGPNLGKKYYGCVDSPKCRGVVELG
jgi:hypothetical protein